MVGLWAAFHRHLRALRATGRKPLDELRDQMAKRFQKKEGREPTPDALEAEVDDYLAQQYRKARKDLLANAIASIYWDCFVKHLKGLKVAQTQLADRLALAESNKTRQSKKQTIPDVNKLFVSALWWRIDLRSVKEFPPNQEDLRTFGEATRAGIMRTIERIKLRELGKDIKHMKVEDFECVRIILADQDSEVFLLEDESPDIDKRRTEAKTRIVENFERRFPGKSINGVTVEQVKNDWLLAYMLFDFGQPHDWKSLIHAAH